jgi:hypothetical protein
LPGLMAVKINETCTSTCLYSRSHEVLLQIIAEDRAVVVK